MTKKVKTSLQDRLLLFQSGESGGRRLKIIYQNKRAREVLSANTNINSSRTIAAADRLLLFAAVATCVKKDRETETEHAVVSTKNFRLQVPCFKKLRKKKSKTNTNKKVKRKEKSHEYTGCVHFVGEKKRERRREKNRPVRLFFAATTLTFIFLPPFPDNTSYVVGKLFIKSNSFFLCSAENLAE